MLVRFRCIFRGTALLCAASRPGPAYRRGSLYLPCPLPAKTPSLMAGWGRAGGRSLSQS